MRAAVGVCCGGLAAAASAVAVMGLAWDSPWVAKARVLYATQRKWEGVTLAPGTYRHNPALEEAVRSHLSNDAVGLHILCAPRGSGKTTTVARVIQQARDDGDVSAVVVLSRSSTSAIHLRWPFWMSALNTLAGYVGTEKPGLLRWFTVTLRTFRCINDVIPEKAVIVVDDAEIFNAENPEAFIRDLYSIAKHGAETKQYTTFVIVNDPVLALRLHAINDGHKVKMVKPRLSPTFALPPQECRDLAAMHGRARRMSEPRLELFMDDTATARTPGFAVANAAAYAREDPPKSLRAAAVEASDTWEQWTRSAAKWRD